MYIIYIIIIYNNVCLSTIHINKFIDLILLRLFHKKVKERLTGRQIYEFEVSFLKLKLCN